MAPARRRRAVHAAQQDNLPDHANIRRFVFSPAAKTAFVVIGTAGLAALAIAVFGPQRFQREIVKPVRSAVGDQAGQLWADSRPLREQISKLFSQAQNDTGREKLVKNFQSWVGHFRAT